MAGSLPPSTVTRVQAFFNANPDEELEIGQACVKFDVAEQTLRLALRVLEERGVLEYVRVIRRRSKGARRAPVGKDSP